MGWLRQLFSRRRRYDDLSVSVQEHLDEKVDELMEEGMSRKDAEHAARRQFGNVLLTEQRGREAWQWQTVESLWADTVFALRQLWKSRGVTAIVVLTLALGVGAATAVFSVAYGVLVDPFPYKDVHTLATPKLCSPRLGRCYWDTYTPSQFLELEQKTSIFSGVTASTVGNVTLTGAGEAQQIRGNYLTANTFDVLGVQPMLGRASTQQDVSPGHEEVAILSNRYWKSHFGASESVLGQVINVDGHARTIIGVMPQRFLWRGADVYLPVAITPQPMVAGHSHFTLVGRLKPGVTEAQASAQLATVFKDFIQSDPRRYDKGIRFGIMRFDEMFQSGLAGTLYLLLGAVFVLLLIACVNVSSLLLARAVKREHEFVLRAAIGASRLRLVRQVMVESLLLALFAVPVALVFAYGGLQAMLRLVPPDTIPDEALISLNVPVLLTSIGMAVFAVILFGASPAWHSANPRLSGVLTSMRSTGSRGHRRLLSGFVVAEIALSLALLTLAGLMMRSMIAVEKVPVVFPPEHTLMMRVPLARHRYTKPEDKIRFFREALERISHVPGVQSVALDAELPFLYGYGSQIQTGNLPVDSSHVSNLHLVTPTYLAISGLPLLQGHFIDEREISVGAHDAVVTDDFAKKYLPGKDPLGQTVRLVRSDLFEKEDAENTTFTIVGVVGNLPAYPGYQQTFPHLFMPYTVAPVMDTFVIATAVPAESLVPTVRQIITSMDKDQPISDILSLRQLLDRYGYAGPRFALTLFGTFAAAALLLCVIGIYGVFSFATSRRTQEIGVRMALGADRGDVIWMVLRQACALAALGIGVGLPLAFGAAKLAKSQLFQTSQYDPITFVLVLCTLPLLAVAGTWLPARRAAAVDPMVALRTE
ncbi:ABC transporter permease [Terriglobus sp. ADX1]|uniref:ABC transporter permease n=1 Tax=Terriglobus sp. ADX1 TaxID=2794063 RepID=UPI002FE5678E